MWYENPIYVMFAMYLVGVLLIGVTAYFATRNFDDYILGGRSLGSFVTAMSAGASDMSAWLLMGLPGAIFLNGISQAWIAIGLIVGAYFNWLWVAGRLRMHTEFNNNALTLPEYFHHRFGAQHRWLKIISAAIILFFFTIYCASGVVGGAELFQTLFAAGDMVPGGRAIHLDYHTAIWLGAGATIIYTFIGGFLAVSWTDTIQASLMIFALILAPVMVYLNLGGWDTVQTSITAAGTASGLNYGSLWHGVGAVAIISAAAWGLGYFGQPHILARFMAAQNVRSLQNARRIGMTWMILCLGGAVMVGYFGIAFFQEHPQLISQLGEGSNRHQRIFLALSTLLFNPWVVGVVLSAVLAAVMSTLSCQLLVCSSALTEDFYKGLLRKNASQTELVWIGRLMVLAVAAIAIFIAQDPESRVLSLVADAWAGFGAAFGPVVLLSLIWRSLSGAGALAGMLAGALTVIFWQDFCQLIVQPSWGEMYSLVPGFALGLAAAIAVSLISPPRAEVVQRFDEANRAYQQAK